MIVFAVFIHCFLLCFSFLFYFIFICTFIYTLNNFNLRVIFAVFVWSVMCACVHTYLKTFSLSLAQCVSSCWFYAFSCCWLVFNFVAGAIVLFYFFVDFLLFYSRTCFSLFRYCFIERIRIFFVQSKWITARNKRIREEQLIMKRKKAL